MALVERPLTFNSDRRQPPRFRAVPALLLLSVLATVNLGLLLLTRTHWGTHLFELAGFAEDGTLWNNLGITLMAIQMAAIIIVYIMTKRYARQWCDEELRLRESERFARTVVDALPAQIAILNDMGVILTANQAWRDFTVDEAVIERPAEGDNLLAACDRAIGRRSREAAELARAIRAVITGKESEIVLETAGHSQTQESCFLCRIKQFPGRGRTRVVVGFEDITLRKRGEEAVRKAREAADTANAAKSAFLANMSHEIRTPMTAIIGYADLMCRPTLSSQDRVRHAQIVRKNGQHLLSIINDILDVSKIEANKVTVESVPVNLVEMIDDVIGLMRVRAVEKNLNLVAVLDGPIPQTINTDPIRLRQVLMNLLGNAIKFTPKGAVTLRLSSQRRFDKFLVQLDVVDTGIGMTEEQLASVFKPFSQADGSTTRRFGGTGLGLTISKRLANLLGGDIAVQSVFGQGSTFAFWFEAAVEGKAVMVSDLNLHTATECPLSFSQQQLSGTVLLAEDGEDNRELITLMLREAGVEVQCVENGRLAVEAAISQKFDLIMMDMHMPELDGATAIREIRKAGITVPIAAVTANAMAEDRQECLDKGFDDYLAKPIIHADLIALLTRHLRPAAPAPHGQAPLRSTISSEASMRAALSKFISRLPERVAQLSNLLQTQNLDELCRAVHQVKGAAGGYGFAPISELAGRAEKTIRGGEPIDAIRQEVSSLIELIRSVDGFDRTNKRCPSLLLVDDNESIHDLVRSSLAEEQVSILSAFDGETALALAAQSKPDLVLLDFDMPQTNGFEVCRQLKNNQATRDIPVVFLTAATGAEFAVEGLNLGASDYITKPFDLPVLRARVMAALRSKVARDELAQRASVDALTGVANRRYVEERLPAELSMCRRNAQPVSCVMLDIDHFKSVNDAHGHAAGDEVLRQVAQLLLKHVSGDATVCRYGGEEFLITLPGVALNAAAETAEQLRQTIEAACIEHGDKQIPVTCSFGVAEASAEIRTAAQIIENADAALYSAKRLGRNRVVRFDSISTGA